MIHVKLTIKEPDFISTTIGIIPAFKARLALPILAGSDVKKTMGIDGDGFIFEAFISEIDEYVVHCVSEAFRGFPGNIEIVANYRGPIPKGWTPANRVDAGESFSDEVLADMEHERTKRDWVRC